MNGPSKHSARHPLWFERLASQLVALAIFERSHFGRHAGNSSRITIERLLERLSYRRTGDRRRHRR